MFLSNLDSLHLKPVANVLKQELRGLTYKADIIAPNMHLLMLPGTITNHHLYSTSASHTLASSTFNSQRHQVNSLSSTTDQVDLDDFIINAFSNFNTSRRNNKNKYQSPSTVRFDRTRSNQPFRGKCHACGQNNHHSKNCFFLRKLNSCLDFMEKNNFSPNQLQGGAGNPVIGGEIGWKFCCWPNIGICATDS